MCALSHSLISPFMWSSHCLGMIFTLNLESKNIFAFCFSLNTEGFTEEAIFHQKIVFKWKISTSSTPDSKQYSAYEHITVTLQFIECDSRNEKNAFKNFPWILLKNLNKVFLSQLTVQLVACMLSERATAFTSINLAPFFDDGLYICFHSVSCFVLHFLSLQNNYQ